MIKGCLSVLVKNETSKAGLLDIRVRPVHITLSSLRHLHT